MLPLILTALLPLTTKLTPSVASLCDLISMTEPANPPLLLVCNICAVSEKSVVPSLS